METEISLIASSVRAHLWESFFKSLIPNDVSYEVVFVGNLKDVPEHERLVYVKTADCIPPAQCYEIARRNAKGRFIMWVADDCEFSEHLLDKTLKFWEANCGWSDIISIQTNEDSRLCPLDDHRFFGRNRNTPLMAPLGFTSRTCLDDIGGFDRRFLCGQYENDAVMRIYENGGKLHKFEDVCVYIEHLKKHGRSTKFWSGYDYDREVLESTWVKEGYKKAQSPFMVLNRNANPPWEKYSPIENREVVKEPLLPFEPYSDKDILTVSQCPKEWK